MAKHYETLTNKRGDVLANYRVQVVDSEGSAVSIYADASDTPFTDADGNTVNYATADADGLVEFFWTPASGQILQTLTPTGDLVKAVDRFSDNYVLDNFGGEVPQSQVTDLETDLAAKAATADLASTATGKGAALVGFKQSGTGAVARTSEAKLREIISATDFGAVGDDSTVNTTALQAALDALSSGGTLVIPRGTYRSGPLTVTNDNVRIELMEGAVLSFPSIASEQKAITVTADNFSIEGGTLQGPESGAYADFENAIHMVGASTSSRYSGLTVKNVEIKNFRAHGIYAQFVDNIRVTGCNIHDCGYAGAMFLSCNHGWFYRNTVKTITPGAGAPVMYGVSVTHDSTDYDADSDAGTKEAANPFCWDWTIAFNHIEDIDWEGIDAHGGYELRVIGNAVYATQRGISVANSSSDAEAYAGYSNIVSNNVVDGRNADGTTSSREWEAYGINIGGATTVTQTRVVCEGNVVLYKGISANGNGGAIQAIRASNVVIANNVIDHWLGVGVLVTLAGGAVSGNVFGQRGTGYASDTQGKCISDAGPTTKRLTITNNSHDPGSGGAALVGFSQAASATVRPFLFGNRFGAATTPFSLSAAGFCLGTDVTPLVTDTASGTATDISALEGGNGAVHLNNANARTISTFTGATAGQRVTFVNIGAGTQTIDRTNARLDGAANLDVTQYDVVELYFLASNDARQVAKMCSNG